MKHLYNQTAVVTGTAMGMGKVLSRMLLNEGCRVALVDVNRKALEQARQELSHHGECRSFVCDVSNRKAVYRLADKVRDTLGPVTLLVNNAGIVKAGELLDLDDTIIEKTISVNLTALFWTCKAFLPQMIVQGRGHVVNMSSAGGLLAIPNLSAYCATKFGVIGFTDALRQEMLKDDHNIQFTYVCPNTVSTGMFHGSKMVAGTKMLSPEKVCREIIRGVKQDLPMVAVPSAPVKHLTPLVKAVLPIRWMDRINQVLGMWTANDTWTGKTDAQNEKDPS